MITVIKSIEPEHIEQIKETYNSLESNIPWVVTLNSKQAGIQYKDGEDHWSSAVGTLQGEETNYNKLNPIFQNTIFDDIIKEFNLYRSRLMWVLPRSCYSFHRDTYQRIHIPIITNEDCYFLFRSGTMRNLTVDKIWLTDTRLTHTFINTSNYERLHFVGVTVDGEKLILNKN